MGCQGTICNRPSLLSIELPVFQFFPGFGRLSFGVIQTVLVAGKTCGVYSGIRFSRLSR